jgi:ubiquitin carboxyl-terminal hydrolase 5/13
LIAVKNSNADAATEWLFAHMEDPDIDDPLPEEAASVLHII